MTRRILGTLAVAAALLLTPATAYADHGGDDYRQREGCGEQGGGCNNEREEDYSGAGCKYVCPSFDKSPVHDAFNFSPEICMPGATCYYGDKDKRGQQGQQPTSEPNPACLVFVPFHCDPKPS